MTDEQFNQLMAVLEGIRLELGRIAILLTPPLHTSTQRTSTNIPFPIGPTNNAYNSHIRYVWPHYSADQTAILNPAWPRSTSGGG